MSEYPLPSTSPSPCRVSFVVTTRNDDHGGNMIKRTSIFVEGLLQLANKHRLSGELIIVEWNPVTGLRLHELLQPRTKSDIFVIRFIEVLPDLHRTFRNADVIPLFQMIAKNVGIRRARGEFVLATNPDLLFSEELITFLATCPLDRNVMYRIDRTDVPAEIPPSLSVEAQLAWCRERVLRVHRAWGSFETGRWFDMRWIRLLNVIRLLGRLAFARPRMRRVMRRIFSSLALPRIHTNGCGDFTLLAREHWRALRGYPELPIWSMHLDSLLCYTAVAAGISEEVLRPPARIYHLEHGNSWVVMSPEDRLRTFAQKPWVDMNLLQELWGHMYWNGEPLLYNSEDWGLGKTDLHEVCLRSGQWETTKASVPAGRV